MAKDFILRPRPKPKTWNPRPRPLLFVFEVPRGWGQVENTSLPTTAYMLNHGLDWYKWLDSVVVSMSDLMIIRSRVWLLASPLSSNHDLGQVVHTTARRCNASVCVACWLSNQNLANQIKSNQKPIPFWTVTYSTVVELRVGRVLKAAMSFIRSQLSASMELMAWHSGNTFYPINKVTLCQARLVLGRVTAYGQANHLGM